MKKFKKCTFQNYLINKVVPFEIAESIPFSERAALVKSIVDSVIKDGEFAPYMKHMSLIFGLCMAYTNLELDKMSVEEVHELIENSNLGEVLWDNIERNQYSEIVEWIDSMIEYEKQKTGVDRLLTYLIELAKPYMSEIKKELETMAPEQATYNLYKS